MKTFHRMKRMPYFPNEMSGRAYDNRDDRTKKTQPDFTGRVKIRGELLRVSIWLNHPSEGRPKKTLDLHFSDEKQAAAREKAIDEKEKEKSRHAREVVDFSFLGP